MSGYLPRSAPARVIGLDMISNSGHRVVAIEAMALIVTQIPAAGWNIRYVRKIRQKRQSPCIIPKHRHLRRRRLRPVGRNEHDFGHSPTCPKRRFHGNLHSRRRSVGLSGLTQGRGSPHSLSAAEPCSPERFLHQRAHAAKQGGDRFPVTPTRPDRGSFGVLRNGGFLAERLLMAFQCGGGG